MDNQPGVPKPEEPGKPQPVQQDRPSFSYLDLDLMNIYRDGGYNYIIFMVRGEYMVSMREFDYFNYLSYIFEQIRLIQEKTPEGCICDQCQPDFSLIDGNTKITATKIDEDTNEEIGTETKFIPFYDVYELLTNLVVGFPEHNHKE